MVVDIVGERIKGTDVFMAAERRCFGGLFFEKVRSKPERFFQAWGINLSACLSNCPQGVIAFADMEKKLECKSDEERRTF
jgi:hypothetical protein